MDFPVKIVLKGSITHDVFIFELVKNIFLGIKLKIDVLILKVTLNHLHNIIE